MTRLKVNAGTVPPRVHAHNLNICVGMRCVPVCGCACMFVCMYLCVYVFVCACLCVYLFVSMFFVCMCV